MAKAKLIQSFSVIADLAFRVSKFPSPAEEADVISSKINLGGGYTTMITAKLLGMPVVYGGILGHGPISEMVAHQLEKDGIPYLPPCGKCNYSDLGVCTVVTDPSSERTFFTHRGAERAGFRSQEDIFAQFEGENDWITASGYTLAMSESPEQSEQMWSACSLMANTLFDPSPLTSKLEKSHLDHFLRDSKWVSLSKSEAEVITGRKTTAEAAAQLAGMGPNTIVRCGAQGACLALADGSTPIFIPPFEVTAVDSNAAGEVHIASTIFAMSRGADPRTAVTFANLCAAIATTKHGAGKLISRQEVAAYLKKKKLAESDLSKIIT